jgi:hypothetical protein
MSTKQRLETLEQRIGDGAEPDGYLKTSCANQALQQSDPRYRTAALLRDKLGEQAFASGIPPVSGYQRVGTGLQRVYLGPTDAYTVAFLTLLDSGIIELVKRLFADERRAIMRGERLPIDARRPAVIDRQQPDEPGVVYCFWNILDRPELKKIGRSRRRAEERGREWEAALTPAEGQLIVILFSVHTKYNVFAERIVHGVLLCERLAGRVNEVNGQLLTEYFRVGNLMALKLFVMLCVGYIDQWGDIVRRQFETTSPLYSQWLAATANN